MIQAGGLGWLVAAVGFVAGALLVVTEFVSIRYVTTLTASCSDLAGSRLRDTCDLVGHESHHWGFALLGLFVILMTFGAAVGGSRPAAVALLVAGAVGLGISLLHDLPQTTKTGGVGETYADARAHKGSGYWLEIVGSSLAIVCGAYATWRTPPPRRTRARLAEAEAAAAGPEDDAPEEAPA